MDRLACVNIIRFPLQVACKANPSWLHQPTVILEKDGPQARVVMANKYARRKQIHRSMRYAEALSICSTVNAETYNESAMAMQVDHLLSVLRRFSPEVEPAADMPGVFWLNASGLLSLYDSLDAWAQAVTEAVAEAGFVAKLCVGFSKFFTTATTQWQRYPVHVFASQEQELTFGQRIPVDCLVLSHRLHDDLRRLAVHTIGEFVQIPAGELLKRYGREAYFLHQLANSEKWQGLSPQHEKQVFERMRVLDFDARNAHQLLFLIKRELHPMLKDLAATYAALTALHMRFRLDNGSTLTQTIEPADPTLDENQLTRLLHLRLESMALPAAVTEISLTADYTKATHGQLSLFKNNVRRDLYKANETIAVLRSMLGNKSVSIACLADQHLPERQYKLLPARQVTVAMPNEYTPTRVRRIFRSPIELPRQHNDVRNDGWLLSGLEHGAVSHLSAPMVHFGHWWQKPIHREYFFLETTKEWCLWVYFDRTARKWMLQGRVE